MPEIRVLPDAGAVAQEAARLFVELSAGAVAARGRFSVALSGGSTPRAMHRLLAGENYRPQVPWGEVMFFWGDERCVPPDDAESNYRMARETLLDHVPAPKDHIHRVMTELPPAEAALNYEQTLRAFFGDAPQFDLVLLGMGDDGHTASLFPGTAALDEQARWAVENFVTAKGVWRITLTAPAINAAAQVVFMVTGAEKAARLQEVINGDYRPHDLPSQLIKPAQGNLLWLLDEAAASALQK